MLFEGFDKHKIGNTSMFSVGFFLSVDFISSVINPDQVFVGDFNFRFDVFSVGGGLISSFFVSISDEGQISDLCSQGFFLGSVEFISSILSIKILLFKISEQVEC